MNGKSYCFFSAQFLPHLGGVEKYTYNLAKKLVEKGNSVTIVTSNVDKVNTFEVMDGIKVYRMPCFAMMAGRFPIPKINRMFCKIHKVISKKKYDKVIINTRFYLHSLYGMWFGWKNKIRSICIDHGTGHLSLGNKYLNYFANVYEHTITVIEKLFCEEFFGVSEECVKWLRHFHIIGRGVLYNAIDLKEIERMYVDSNYSYKNELKISDKALVITFTGRLIKEKGIYPLINAVVELNKKEKNIYLLIAGDGPERDNIKKRQTDNIILLGMITHKNIVDLLKETDIFCLPTAYPEGLPTSVLEAAACKNFIITTQRGGAKELIVDESYGIVLEDNNALTVKDAIAGVIDRPKYRREASERTYCFLGEKFTWDVVAEKVMNL